MQVLDLKFFGQGSQAAAKDRAVEWQNPFILSAIRMQPACVPQVLFLEKKNNLVFSFDCHQSAKSVPRHHPKAPNKSLSHDTTEVPPFKK